MYSETWTKFWCPHCDKQNWVRYGDLNDPSGWDPDGFQCWKCKSQVPINDYLYYHDDDEVDEIEYDFEPGLKNPTNKEE